MEYNIKLKNEKLFDSDISKIPKKEIENIFFKIEIMKEYGVSLSQVKKLNSYKISDYRLRVGNYRVLFNFYSERKDIVIIRILHRSKLY